MKTNFWHLTLAVFFLAGQGVAFGQERGALIDLTQNKAVDSKVTMIKQAGSAPLISSEGAAMAGTGSMGGCSGGCSSGGCDGGCSSGGCGSCSSGCGSCVAPWAHRSGVFGEYLYLNAQDVEVPYAVEINGPNTAGGILTESPIQVGAIQLVDPDYQSNFRAGGVFALCDDASLVVTYTQFESDDNRNYTIVNAQGNVLRNLASHPRSFDTGSDGLTAVANLDIDFQLGDVDYRSVVACGDLWALNVILGGRYAHLEQRFHTRHSEQINEDVDTTIEFDGGGLRIGLDGEKHASCSGLFVYGKAISSFVSGNFRADYVQGSTTDPVIVDTAWEAGRVVTMYDIELGTGWQSRCGTFRVSGGYMVSGWDNIVKTDEWIRSVQTNDYRDLNGSISFDGFVGRAEVRW